MESPVDTLEDRYAAKLKNGEILLMNKDLQIQIESNHSKPPP